MPESLHNNDADSINSSVHDDNHHHNPIAPKAITYEDKESSVRDHESIHNLGKISTCGDNDEFIIIGNHKYYRDELMYAFGGNLNPGIAPPPTHIFGNATPMGLMGFGVSMFCLGMFKAEAMGIHISNMVVSSAFFYGGLVTFLAGNWEFASGNTFAGTAFASFGGFWASYGAIYVDNFSIIEAYGGSDNVEFKNAIGFFFLGWAIFMTMLASCTMKSTWPFFLLFAFIILSFLMLAIGGLTANHRVDRAGGVFAVLAAVASFYNAYAGLVSKSSAYITLKPIPLPFAPVLK